MKPKYWAIIILAVLAVAAGVIYYVNQPALDSGPIVVHREVKPQSPATTTLQTDLKDWKTYTNSQYGFELKFPPQWSKMKVEDAGLSFYLPYADTGKFSFVCGLQMYSSGDWNTLQNSEVPHPTQNIGTDKDGYTYTYQCGQDDEGYVGFEQYNQAVKATGDRSGNGPYKEFREMVLPTFKFTQPQADTSAVEGWKTYTNSQYGFEVDYPLINQDSDVTNSTQYYGQNEPDVVNISFGGDFNFFIHTNVNALSLQDWFEKIIDDKGILLKNGNLKLEKTKNGVTILNRQDSVSLPDKFSGDLQPGEFYVETPDKKYVIEYSVNFQDNNLGNYSYDELRKNILDGFKFTK